MAYFWSIKHGLFLTILLTSRFIIVKWVRTAQLCMAPARCGRRHARLNYIQMDRTDGFSHKMCAITYADRNPVQGQPTISVILVRPKPINLIGLN